MGDRWEIGLRGTGGYPNGDKGVTGGQPDGYYFYTNTRSICQTYPRCDCNIHKYDTALCWYRLPPLEEARWSYPAKTLDLVKATCCNTGGFIYSIGSDEYKLDLDGGFFKGRRTYYPYHKLDARVSIYPYLNKYKAQVLGKNEKAFKIPTRTTMEFLNYLRHKINNPYDTVALVHQVATINEITPDNNNEHYLIALYNDAIGHIKEHVTKPRI